MVVSGLRKTPHQLQGIFSIECADSVIGLCDEDTAVLAGTKDYRLRTFSVL
jgi:hypothetical protein